MKWSELIDRVANEAGTSQRQARSVLEALGAVTLEALEQGDEVAIRNVGIVGARRSKGRAMRSIADNRKIMLGEHFVVRFRPSAAARRAVSVRVSSYWKDPEHQAAWRVAETLVGDLNLYHASRAPGLGSDVEDSAVHEACRGAFGSLWEQAFRTYEQKVGTSVRETKDYLAEAARRRWSN